MSILNFQDKTNNRLHNKGHLLNFNLWLGLFLLISTFLVAAKEPSIQIKVEYSMSADVFELMDNVSNWWPGFTEDEYQKYWNKQVKSDPKDIGIFKKYVSIRKKYYNDPDQKEKNPLNNRNGFFANSGSIKADPYAEAFYSSNTLDEAFTKLEKKLSDAELSFVKSFYKHFETRYKPIVQNDEKEFSGSIELVRRVFEQQGIDDFFNKIVKFYNSKETLTYRVLYTWWPPISRTNASPTGQYLIMRNNPVTHKNRNDSEIIAHEIIHAISTNQPLEQKKILTETFLKKCPVQDKLRKLVIFEEPLAVVFGQLLFLEKFRPEQLSLSENLYNDPWINTFARILFFPLKTRFEKGETINQGIVTESAELCFDLYQTAKILTSHK